MKLIKNPQFLLVLLVFLLHIFFRFYNVERINLFGWDQVDNAWAAKDIIVDHKFPLLGMVAKGNSGFYIGPAYYYLISIFYYFTNLDPIASSLFAGFTSIFTFWTLFYITKKLFNFRVALLSVFIHTVSFFVISSDRVQWPVNFIAPISLIIFYALYKIITGEVKYLLLLSIAVGFSFHVHFTSVFYPLIILLALPFFPRTKKMFLYAIAAFGIFTLWLTPILISEFTHRASSSKNIAGYANSYYHGLHLRRVFQLISDAFIEFESILYFKVLKNIEYFLVPVFYLIYLRNNYTKERKLLCYLVGMWFLVPWVVFSTYSGEISNYYFSFNRLIAIIVLAYVSVRIYEVKGYAFKFLISIFWLYYAISNISNFFNSSGYRSLFEQRQLVKSAINEGKVINFTQGDGKSYLYFIYTRK